MTLIEARQRLKTTTGILILAAVAVPRVSFLQPAFEPSTSDVQRQLVETILDKQTQDGIDSPELIAPLTALGLFYAEQGDHALAIAAIERARLVVRKNYGLHSLEEVPLLRQLIRSQEARGNIETRWNLEQKLLDLVRRTSDLRAVPVLREIGDRRLDAARRYRAGEFPPEIVLGCYYDRRSPQHERNCHAGSKRAAYNNLYSEGLLYHMEADRILARRDRWIRRGCEKPSMLEIPDNEKLSRREEKQITDTLHRYLTRMADFVACTEAKLQTAASANAPSSQLAWHESVKDAAIAEREEVRDLYEERIALIGYSCSVIAFGVACTGSSMSSAEVQTRAQHLRTERERQKRLAERTAPYFPPRYDNAP